VKKVNNHCFNPSIPFKQLKLTKETDGFYQQA